MKKIIHSEKAFLGRGWSFPPTFIKTMEMEAGAMKEVGKLNMSVAEQDIYESLLVLLTTLPGERIMEPRFGCDLREMLFEPMDTTFIGYIEDLIATAVLLHEPRIKLNRININTDNVIEGRVDIELDYTVRSTNSRFNFVYPFYIKEGTGITR